MGGVATHLVNVDRLHGHWHLVEVEARRLRRRGRLLSGGRHVRATGQVAATELTLEDGRGEETCMHSQLTLQSTCD